MAVIKCRERGPSPTYGFCFFLEGAFFQALQGSILGVRFGSLFVSWATLGTVLGHFAAVFLPLGPKGFKKGGPRETKSCSRAAPGLQKGFRRAYKSPKTV